MSSSSTMVPTVTDIGAFISPLIAEYPSFSADNCRTLALELSALQRTWFLHYKKQYGLMSLPSAAYYPLSDLLDEFSVPLSEDRIVGALSDDEYLPRVDCEEKLRTSRPCCSVMSDTLHARFSDVHATYLKILYLRCPPTITYASGTFTGNLYVPVDFLPAVTAKLRQVICTLAGETEQADCYARAYNEFLAAMPVEEQTKPRRKAL